MIYVSLTIPRLSPSQKKKKKNYDFSTIKIISAFIHNRIKAFMTFLCAGIQAFMTSMNHISDLKAKAGDCEQDASVWSDKIKR